MFLSDEIYLYNSQWRQSLLNSAGALQGGDGEFRGILTPFYTINIRGGRKSGSARFVLFLSELN